MTTSQHSAPTAGRPSSTGPRSGAASRPRSGAAAGPLAGLRAGRVLTGPTAGRANAVALMLLLLASLAQACCLIEVGRALGLLVAGAGGAGRIAVAAWGSAGPGLLLRALLAAAVSALAAGAADGVSRRSAAREEGVIRGRVLAALLRLGPLRSDSGPGGPGAVPGGPGAAATTRAGAAVGLLTDGAERVSRYRQTFLAPTAAAALAPIAVLVLAAVAVDWLSALVLAAAVVVVPWAVVQVHRRTRSSSGASRRRRAVLSARYLEVIQGLETLVLARAGDRAVAELEEAGEENRRGLMRLLAGNQLVILLTDGLASLLLVVGAAALSLVRVRSGAITAGDAIALVLVSVVLLEPLDRVGSFFYVGMSGRANERLMTGLLRRAGDGTVPGTRTAEPDGVAGADGAADVDGGIAPTAGSPGARVRLSAVTARWPEAPVLTARHPGGHPGGRPAGYGGPAGQGAPTAPAHGRPAVPAAGSGAGSGAGTGTGTGRPAAHGRPDGRPSGRDVLTGVDLDIEPGEHVAVVGPSGAGKSTLLALLDGELLPTVGTVAVDGVTAARGDEAARDALRARSAVVTQSTWLFTGTVADNLRLARPDATDDELWAALAAAGLDDEVRATPDGLATAVGERGTALSGGQAQRVALARAFLADRPLLLLDEPTSQVDLASEAVIVEALGRLGEGRTVVTVTHRRAAADDADRVLTVEGGRLR
ncbi:hypothetical protein AXF14_05855 [Actinomyces radicidentis]|uniref:ABC transporter ATP-binding protein n=1 Tax=Actinomyces radicidentis TaxID=111015 RepID=A0A0X8JEQ2_ACTRD|nr:ABC transporter ATP-binding protein [Actinomyces radicidentis]AMD87197.1 hypothetical protein AXF14_05855 [Actinomyces radicidentis]